MRLLIVTQAVDADSSTLGFFVEWLREFSRQCEEIQVIGLAVGRHDLPANVRLLGEWPNAAVRAAWSGAIAGVLPSTCREACPTVVIEAMLAGRPMIATGLGGTLDLVEDGQSGLLVLDQVGHHLHDRGFDVRLQGSAGSPVDSSRRVPLRGCRLDVETRREVAPDRGLVIEVEARVRTSFFDQCTACRQAPCRRGLVDHFWRTRPACALSAGPAIGLNVPTRDQGGRVAQRFRYAELDAMPVLAAPGSKVQPQRRVASLHR